MRTFEFKDGKSNKFWHIELQGQIFTVTFGRIGTKGQSQTKAFADAATAKKEHDKLVAEKLKKGYVETTPGTTAAPAKATSSEQKAIESALVNHADEVAAHSAYADYLMEQGDPRGEFIQVQLSLEDATRSKKERDALRKREAALLKERAKEWLGDAGRLLVGNWSGEDKPYYFRFARGWVDYIRVAPAPEAMFAAIARSPESRLLRRLEVIYDMRYHPFDFDQFITELNEVLTEDEKLEMHTFYMYDPPSDILSPLTESPNLSNLRILKLGFSDNQLAHSTQTCPFEKCTVAQILDLMKKCPRLEELYINNEMRPIDDVFSSELLANIRVLQYYYASAYNTYRDPHEPYPLGSLAANKSLKNLTTLRFHPGRDAEIDIDELDALLNSKNLPSLEHLQVHMIANADEAADRIARSGILKRLKTLDIAYGVMTDDGARVLAAACPDLKKLEVLNVSHHALTSTGVSALKKTGVRVIADEQHDAEDYYYSVDWE